MRFDLNDDEDMSITKFENMLESNEIGFFDGDEFEQIIEHYLDLGKMPLARKAIAMSIAQHPESVNLRLFNAEMFIFDDKYDLAHELLNELHNVEPDNAEIFVQKANIYSKTEQHDKAIQLLELAVDLTDDPADIYNLIGMEYLFREDYGKAKSNFKKCLELDQADYSALYNVMYCFDFLNEQNDAIAFLRDYLETNPYSEVAWHQLGKQYYDIKKYDKALEAFEFAIIADDSFIGAYLEKGKVLEKLNRYAEAIAQYELTLSLDDPTSFAYLRMGKSYLKLKNQDKAILYFSKAVDEDPLLDKGWLAIVNFYCSRTEFRKALMYMEKAIEIDSENAMYWNKYASINCSLGFYEEAEYGYKLALELGNYELKTWIERSDILLKLGELEAVVSHLQNGLEFHPKNENLELRLGGALVALGKSYEGLYYLKNVFALGKDQVSKFNELYPRLSDNSSVTSLIKSLD
jgi:tetratricopeptide (TPR) repeat protein